MKDHLIQITQRVPVEMRRNIAREYLQSLILRLCQDLGVLSSMALVEEQL